MFTCLSHLPKAKLVPEVMKDVPVDKDLLAIVKDISTNGSTDAEPVNPPWMEYIYTPTNACVNRSDYFLLVLVKSDVSHISLRMAVRRTWGSISHENIKVVYLLGFYSIVQNLVDAESRIYNDILQGDFVDIYDNNTNKTTMAYRWVVEHCVNTQYLLFVDDDFFTNIFNINQFLSSLSTSNSSELFMGYVLHNGKPYRQMSSKWYITREEYPYDHYPDYPAGGAILMSMSIAKWLKTAFPYVQYIHIDDCYIGLVAHSLKLRPQHDDRFSPLKPVPVVHLNETFASHGYGDHRTLQTDWNTFIESLPDDHLQLYYQS